jgi:CheY-like chemotaxis protein
MKLLIVDNSARFRALLRSLLAGLNVQIEECSDGDQACSMYEQGRHDIVLMDIRMDRMNGLIATQRIKTQCPAARIIILTAFDDDDLRRAAGENGASGYCLKDDLPQLMQLISSLVSSAAAAGG